jgi:hypothetical protein
VNPRLQPHEPMTGVERAGLVIGLLLAAALMWPLRGQLADDTFVHLQYARHLAHGQGPVFNAGEHVFVCTSPLWAALVGDAMSLGWDGLVASRLLGFIATLASIPLFLQIMRRIVDLAPIRALATVAWASHAWMLQWSVSGLETPLAVALMLAGFVAFTEGKQWGSRPIRTGTLWTLAALTRPQLSYLLVLWGIVLLVDTYNRAGLRRLVLGMLPPVAIFGSWMLFARLYFGTFWPRTLALHGGDQTGFDFALLWQHVGSLMTTDGILIVLIVAALVLGGRAVWMHRLHGVDLLPYAWVISLPILLAARGIPPVSRYLVAVAPVVAWLAWRLAERWWLGGERESHARRTQATVLAFVVATLFVIQNLQVYRNVVLPEARRSAAVFRDGLVQWGEWFGRHTTAETVLASTEVGALGFISERHVIDLTGLISPELESVGQTPGAIENFAFADVARPEFLVHRAPHAYALLDRPYAAALTPLGRAPAYVPVGDPDSVYSVYHIDWRRFDALSARR